MYINKIEVTDKRFNLGNGAGSDAVNDLQLSFTSATRTGFGDEPRLDLELETAASTASRYSALLNLLGREMQIGRLAIQGSQ